MVYKKIHLVGGSKKSFEDAVNNALAEASKTIREIRWIEVQSLGAKVENNQIYEYQADVRIAFEIQR